MNTERISAAQLATLAGFDVTSPDTTSGDRLTLSVQDERHPAILGARPVEVFTGDADKVRAFVVGLALVASRTRRA